MIDFDGLRTDRSWRLTWSDDRLEEAVFRLEPDTAAERGALVARLGGDASDPEQWEAVLVEALLTDPAAADLRRLELHLTDFHHSARRAAAALGSRRRERLAELYFGHDFEFLYEDAATSTGGTVDPLSRLHEGFVGETALWEALPALRDLTVEGGLLFDDIDGVALKSLTSLRLRGAVLAGGEVFPGRLPSVVTLTLDVASDVFGVCCPVDLLEELDGDRFPALRHLDLGRAEFDPGDLATLRALAAAPILPRLESLRLRSLLVPDHVAPDRLAALAELAPAFAHLDLSIVGNVDVEGADRVLGLSHHKPVE
ncbi:hypothetical protein [Actinosynnema sp. NPDC020468]|uniref:hypothetical protein n=1 Tax=Actinosynnema sp. NPDC020468 TaxID=3154488 RepID=UPI0033FFC1CC